eukprot:CAMPEP_0183335732 /NCGR_PEP_ID=MMETSP0164_2-20130417/3938_1 /TAXON_ID=221442 /ORGANISM="Coccolithus pelagicus ssp braarudi, Strain PLY182g" /LENGTH=51 /DNA_ID=CAMNT_0025505139 /DNA_START=214 /DNA_END=369 /DNA_ORIENTATION=+
MMSTANVFEKVLGQHESNKAGMLSNATAAAAASKSTGMSGSGSGMTSASNS